MAEKREIIFQKTMNADKRNADSAYLIKNVMDLSEKGLYPRRDYIESTTGIASGSSLVDIIGTADGRLPWVVTLLTNTFSFFQMNGVTAEGTLAKNVIALAYGGINDNLLYIVEDDDLKVYRARIGVGTIIEEVATFPSAPNVNVGIWDGLYFWWVGAKIWRQLEDGTPELMMSDSGIANARFLANYEDYVVAFSQSRFAGSSFGGWDSEINVFFYDKANTTFFSRRIKKENAVLLGGANVGGRLMLVIQEREKGNAKETFGRIKVFAWDGVDFVEINSIKSGRTWLRIPSTYVNGVTCKSGEDYMLLSVDDNDSDKNTDLYKNYIYKIYRDGSIQVESEVTPNGDPAANFGTAVYVGPQYNAFGVAQSVGVAAKVMYLEDTDDSYDGYVSFTQTEYITNFFCNPYNQHTLLAFNVSFEKMFRNSEDDGTDDEKLEVYYRTSDREDWKLLGVVTPELVIENVNKRIDMADDIPLPMQRYQITKLPNEDALPEFNEIQFKFRSYNGFSIIGCWFEYDYTTRNTKM